MNYIIPFIILITIVVFIHEYGHYYFARRYGVAVTDFSIGFGKEIFGFITRAELDGNFVSFLLADMLNFLGTEMYLVKQNKKKF